MPENDPDRLLALLRDPNLASAEIAAAAGVTREEAGRAARLVTTIARVQPEEAASLPAVLAGAVLRAAAAAGRVELVAALAARPEKEVAKEAKRLLHHLRVRGVSVPEPLRPAAPAPALSPVEPPPLAYASTTDGTGERAVWLPRAVPGRGIEVAQAVLSDERGIVELQLGTLGRKEWRAFVKGLLERGTELGVGEIERGRAHALISAARALNGPSGTRLPEGADHWLTQLGPAPPLAPPGASLPALAEAEAAAALAGSDALLDLPLLRGWAVEASARRELERRLDEAEASPLELSPEQRRERRDALLRSAADEIFGAARRARLSARLLEVAEHLEARGQEGHARAAAAAGRALASGRPAAEIPFATGLLARSLAGQAPPRQAAAAAIVPGAV
jgi:hypothetical protein